MTYGEALPSDSRADGDVPVISSGGVTGSHIMPNTHGPCVVVGRKGSHGSVWWSEVPSFTIDTAYFIDDRNTRNDLRWLYYVLIAADLGGHSSDVGVPGLSRDFAYTTHVPQPPALAEQRRIADFLDEQVTRIDQIIDARRRQESLVVEAQRTEIDTVATLGRPTRRLRTLLAVLTDGTHNPPPRVLDGIPFLTARNVRGNTLSLTGDDTCVEEAEAELLDRATRIRPGDLLLSVKGTVGNVGIVPPGFPRAQMDRNLALLRADPSRLDSRWLYWVLRSSMVQDQIRLAMGYSAQPGIYLGAIGDLRIENRELETQRQDAPRLERGDRAIRNALSSLERSTERLRELKRSLITSTVLGDFDVVVASGRGVPV